MKKIIIKIKNKIDTYIQTNRILKNQIKDKNDTIQKQANNIDDLLNEKNEYREKCLNYKREEKEIKQQLRFLTKRDNKLQAIEQLFEGKGVKLRDITKILDGDE